MYVCFFKGGLFSVCTRGLLTWVILTVELRQQRHSKKSTLKNSSGLSVGEVPSVSARLGLGFMASSGCADESCCYSGSARPVATSEKRARGWRSPGVVDGSVCLLGCWLRVWSHSGVAVLVESCVGK